MGFVRKTGLETPCSAWYLVIFLCSKQTLGSCCESEFVKEIFINILIIAAKLKEKEVLTLTEDPLCLQQTDTELFLKVEQPLIIGCTFTVGSSEASSALSVSSVWGAC